MWIDTQVTALKVEQAIREAFYKTKTFYYYFKGMRLGATAGFPEQIGVEKLTEYSFESDNRIKIKFNIEVETYQPVFDPTTEMDANNYMRGIGYKMYSHDNENDGTIEIKSPIENTVVPKEFPLMVEWSFNKEGGVMPKVDAFWLYTDDNEWELIEKGIANHEFWIWNIPETFTDYRQPSITYEETDDIRVHRQNSFNIIDPGYFMTPTPNSNINIILEMKDDQGRIIYTGDSSINLTLTHYKIAKYDSITNEPINPVWVDPSAGIVYPRDVDYKEIDIHIANSVNNDVFGVVKNIKVV
jgi:hypothetical protein